MNIFRERTRTQQISFSQKDLEGILKDVAQHAGFDVVKIDAVARRDKFDNPSGDFTWLVTVRKHEEGK